MKTSKSAKAKISDVSAELRRARFEIIRRGKRLYGKDYLSTAFEDAEITATDTSLLLSFRYRVITEITGFGPYQTWVHAIVSEEVSCG